MIVSSSLLVLLGVLGGIDILLYHSISHGIRQHADSRLELFTHFLRGPTYFILFLGVPNFEFHGYALWALGALLIFDLGISLADFWLESHSRQAFGGLPRGEYVLHVLLAMIFGALCAAIFFEGGKWVAMPTQLVWEHQNVPLLVKLALGIMAPLVLWSGCADLVAAAKLKGRTS